LSTCYPQTKHSSPKSSHGTSAPFWALCRQSANLPLFWGCWRFADAESARSGAQEPISPSANRGGTQVTGGEWREAGVRAPRRSCYS